MLMHLLGRVMPSRLLCIQGISSVLGLNKCVRDCTNLEMTRILFNQLENESKICQVSEVTTLQ